MRPSFDPYNEKRAIFLAGKGVEEMLRPLFCTMDVNLDSQFVGSTLLVDREITSGFLSADSDAYAKLKTELGQRLLSDDGRTTVKGTDGKPVLDTDSEFTYPSRGQIDTSYSRQARPPRRRRQRQQDGRRQHPRQRERLRPHHLQAHAPGDRHQGEALTGESTCETRALTVTGRRFPLLRYAGRRVGKLGKHSTHIVALASAFGVGCVLFVEEPAGTTSGTCHFDGETATCGSCIVRSCKALVDQCCADGICRTVITDLDACALKGGAACTPVVSPAAPSAAADALANCVLQSCDKDCGNVSGLTPAGETPASSTLCTKPSDGKSCRCEIPSVTDPPNAVSCSPALVPNALCCAELDWPLTGTKCECRTVSCETTNGGNGCSCSTFGTGPLTACSTSGGCCEGSSGGCECGAVANLCALAPPGTGGIKSVPSCGRSTVSCGPSKKAVSRCSAQ